MFQASVAYDGEAGAVSDTARPLTKKQRRALKRERDAAQYASRKEAGLCVRCADPAADGSLWCSSCGPVVRERIRLRNQQVAKERRAAGQCVTCGHDKRGRKQLISQAAIPPSPARWHTEGRKVQVRQVTEGDGRTRNRGVGQDRRGRMSRSAEDEQDLRLAQAEMEAAIRALAHAHSPQVKLLPVKQREATMEAALARLHLTQRLIVEILNRHKYAV